MWSVHGYLDHKKQPSPGPSNRPGRGTRVSQRKQYNTALLSIYPFGPRGFESALHRRTPRPSTERIRRKAMLPFGSQQRISRIQPSSADGSRQASKGWSSVGHMTYHNVSEPTHTRPTGLDLSHQPVQRSLVNCHSESKQPSQNLSKKYENRRYGERFRVRKEEGGTGGAPTSFTGGLVLA